MSNFNQEMTRWTKPTNLEFFSRHKGAIKLYGVFSILAQVIWLFFSNRPFSNLITENVLVLAAYATVISFVVLVFMHYVLHELLRYVFYNLLDNDPNTVNSPIHYLIVILIIGGMFTLDVTGIHSSIRDEGGFESLRKENDSKKSQEVKSIESRFDSDVKNLAEALEMEKQAITTAYASKIASASKIKTYDSWDVAAKNKKIAGFKSARDSEIAEKQQEFASAKKELTKIKNDDIKKAEGKADSIASKIDSEDGANAAKASNYAWIVSAVCLLILLGCTYQSTYLRIGSGQAPVSRFTISDATGSATTKLFDVITDIWERWIHIALSKIHHSLTPRELDELDGAFTLKKKTGEITLSASGDNPPKGGSGGSSTPPPHNPTAPAQPLGGQSVHKATPKKEWQTPAIIETNVDSLIANRYWSDLNDDEKLDTVSKLRRETGFPIKLLYMACEEKNPQIPFFDSVLESLGTPPLTEKKSELQKETVITDTQSVITGVTSVITEVSEKTDPTNEQIIKAFREGIRDLNSECRNYETQNGTIDRIVNRIAEKLVKLYNESQAHKDIIPQNVYENFSKAYNRAKTIIEEYKEAQNE